MSETRGRRDPGSELPGLSRPANPGTLQEVASNPDPFVWVFNPGSRPFPGGVFTRLDLAEAWIATHRLTGVLTLYPVDEGCFDWAVRVGRTGMKAETLERNRYDAAFIGGFSSASQEHYHYEDGTRRA